MLIPNAPVLLFMFPHLVLTCMAKVEPASWENKRENYEALHPGEFTKVLGLKHRGREALGQMHRGREALGQKHSDKDEEGPELHLGRFSYELGRMQIKKCWVPGSAYMLATCKVMP